MKAFKETIARVTKVDMTVADYAKMLRTENHEVWRTCKDCNEHFDWKMHDKCPGCGGKNF